MGIKLLHILGRTLGIAPSLASEDQRRAVCTKLEEIRGRTEIDGSPYVIRRFLELSLSGLRFVRGLKVAGFRWSLGLSAAGLFACYLFISLGGIFGALNNAQSTLPWNVYDRSVDAARTNIKNAPALAALPRFKDTGVIERETRYLGAYVAHYNSHVRIAFSGVYIIVV